MDKKIKAKWLKALRSGKYEQGEAALRAIEDGTEQYCCLGVLCELVKPEGWRPITYDGEVCGYKHGRNEGMPSRDLLRAVGISEKKIVEETGENIAQTLADMNDNGDSFGVIANWIEKNL